MKLFIKQILKSFGTHYSITDESGEEKYTVKGDYWSLRRMTHIYDVSGEEIARLYRKLFEFLPRYILEIPEAKNTEIIKEYSISHTVYRIDNSSLKLDGDLLGQEFTMYDSATDEPIMNMSKTFFSFLGGYEMDIIDEKFELTAIGIALTVDYVTTSRR